MSPKVSVVIPVYNAGLYLNQCLDSIVNQTLREIEVICINDGSTDNSLKILNEYAAKDNRFKIIDQENQGAAPSRNKGIDLAQGDYLMVLDSDDFFEDNMLEYLYYLAKADQSDVAICGFYLYNNKTNEDIEIIYPKIPENIISPFNTEECKDNLFNISAPNAWTKLWKTELIKKNSIKFDDFPYCDDQKFAGLGLACSKKISFTNIPFIHYRYFISTQQTSNKPKTLAPLCKTYCNLYQGLVDKNLFKTYEKGYLLRLKTSLQYEFKNGMGKEVRKSLLCIPQTLPEPILQQLFMPKDRPAVSVIVPVYNMEKYLPECLDSLINQTLKNIEIICVDDGSTDDSLKILQDYAAKDNRIKILTQANSRQSIARRNAMKIATGEYIQCVDADDFIDLDTLECLYLYAKLYELDMCFFIGSSFTEMTTKKFNDNVIKLTWLPDNFIPVFTYKNVFEVIHQMNVGACLTFYRHDFLKDNHIEWLDEKIAYEDTPFFIESLFRAERMGGLKEDFYHRRKHTGCTTEQLESNFSDYCQVVLKALVIAKELADEKTLDHYTKGIVYNAFMVYKKGCSSEIQQRFKTTMYDFFIESEKITNIRPVKEIRNWCKVYEKRRGQF